jgi:hypothetical protein
MKKLAILISGTLFCLAGMAAESSDSWVVAGKDRISCDKVNVGIAKARITLDNGEKMTLPLDQINSYSSDGMVFNKKMVYKNGKATGRKEFMELIKINGDLSLYKTTQFNADLGTTVDVYNVYKGENLYLKLDNKSMPSVLNFFNVKWEYK